jgi:hypothetical protein
MSSPSPSTVISRTRPSSTRLVFHTPSRLLTVPAYNSSARTPWKTSSSQEWVLTGPLPSNGCRILERVRFGHVFTDPLPNNAYTRLSLSRYTSVGASSWFHYTRLRFATSVTTSLGRLTWQRNISMLELHYYISQQRHDTVSRDIIRDCVT